MNVSALQTLALSFAGMGSTAPALGFIQMHNDIHHQALLKARRAGLQLSQAHLVAVKMYPSQVGVGFLFREVHDEIGRAQMLLFGPAQANGLQFHNPFPDELYSLSLASYFDLLQNDAPSVHEYASLVFLQTQPQPGIDAANLEALSAQRFDYVRLEPGTSGPSLKSMLDIPVASLDFGEHNTGIQETLSRQGISFVGELVRRSRRQLNKTKGLEAARQMEIVSLLNRLGLHFDMDVGTWKPPQNS